MVQTSPNEVFLSPAVALDFAGISGHFCGALIYWMHHSQLHCAGLIGNSPHTSLQLHCESWGSQKRIICQKIWTEGRLYKKPENNDELAVTGARNIWFVEEKYERSNMCSRGLNPCNLCNSRTDCTVQSRRQGQTEGLVQQSHDWRWKSRFNSYESVVDWEKGVFQWRDSTCLEKCIKPRCQLGKR